MWHIPDAIIKKSDDNKAIRLCSTNWLTPTFVTKVQELYGQRDIESFDILLFKDGRIIERYSRPQRIGGQSVGHVWSLPDITERKRAEEKLAYTALHDPLTNLPNRVLFMDRLQHAMKRAERHKNFMFAVLSSIWIASRWSMTAWGTMSGTCL